MATEVQVSTPLSFDSANRIEVGRPVSITISNTQNVVIDGVIVSPQDCGIHSSSNGSKYEPQISLPTVNVSGKKNWTQRLLRYGCDITRKRSPVDKIQAKSSR